MSAGLALLRAQVRARKCAKCARAKTITKKLEHSFILFSPSHFSVHFKSSQAEAEVLYKPQQKSRWKPQPACRKLQKEAIIFGL